METVSKFDTAQPRPAIKPTVSDPHRDERHCKVLNVALETMRRHRPPTFQ